MYSSFRRSSDSESPKQSFQLATKDISGKVIRPAFGFLEMVKFIVFKSNTAFETPSFRRYWRISD